MWLLFACSAPLPASDTDAPDETVDTGAAAEIPPIGVVTVRELRIGDAGCRDGEISTWGLYDRAPPQSVYGFEWEYWGDAEPMDDDVCVGAETNGGHCEPECGSDAFCTVDGECAPWPTHLDAGSLEIGGLTRPFVLERTSLGTYSLTDEPPRVLFAEESVTLAAAGGADLPAFSAHTRTPEPLDVDFACDPLLSPAGDVTFTWTPQGPDFRVRLLIQNLVHGGGTGTTICEGPDDGEMVIPADVLEAPPSAWAYSVDLSRFSRGAAAVGTGSVRIEAAEVLRCATVTPAC